MRFSPKLSPFVSPLVFASLFLCSPAFAAEPTTSECLAASDASLKDGNEHQLRAERRHLLVCAASSCPSDIRKECTRRVEEVNAAMPALVFEAKNGAGNDLSDVKVMMDGEVLADHLNGTALVVDPGKHSFVFEAQGEDSITKELVVREGEKDRRETIQFGHVAAPVAGPVGATPADGGEASGGMPTQRAVAIVLGGVGVAGVGVGSAFGVMAMQRKKDAQKMCPNECADQRGADAWQRAGTAATISTVSFVAGGVLLAGAAVLWFTAGPASQPAEVVVGVGNVQIRGSF
jgi:hypothetical protein